MAYYNLDKKRTERLLNKETKFNLDIGSTPQELKDISYKFYIQNLTNKKYNTSSTFPKIIPDYNFEEVRNIQNRYFTESTEDLKAKMMVQSDFLNQQEEEIKKAFQRRKDITRIEEIKKLNESGIVLPEGVDFFSEEGQSIIRSEASKYKGGYDEYLKDKGLAQQRNRMEENERKLEEKLQVVITTLLRENDPRVINETISNAVVGEISKLFSNLTEKQQLNLAKKVDQKTKEELQNRKQKDVLEALGGAGAGAGVGGKEPPQTPTQREEIQARLDHLKHERKQIGSKGDMKYIGRKIVLGTKITKSEEERKERYDDLTEQIKELGIVLQRIK